MQREQIREMALPLHASYPSEGPSSPILLAEDRQRRRLSRSVTKMSRRRCSTTSITSCRSASSTQSSLLTEQQRRSHSKRRKSSTSERRRRSTMTLSLFMLQFSYSLMSLTGVMLLIRPPDAVSAHGYLKTPRSRNLVACELNIYSSFIHLGLLFFCHGCASVFHLSVESYITLLIDMTRAYPHRSSLSLICICRPR